MLFRDVLEERVGSQVWPIGRSLAVALFDCTRSCDRCKRYWLDVHGLQELDELLLSVLGVQLDLVYYWPNPRIREQIHDQLSVEIAEAKALRHAAVHQLFKCRPQLMKRYLRLCEVHCRPMNKV